MNCLECQEILQQRLDGQPVADRAALEQHLATCTECRERHAAAALLLEGLRNLAQPQPSPALAERTTALVLRERRIRQFRRRFWTGLAVAASLLFAVAGYLWLNRSPAEPPFVKGPAPKPQKQPPQKVDPGLRKSVGEAREALAALLGQAADKVREDARVLDRSATSFEFVSLGGVPRVGPLTQPLNSTAEGLRQSGHGASASMRTVSRSARRAFNYFLRKMPPLQPASKRAS